MRFDFFPETKEITVPRNNYLISQSSNKNHSQNSRKVRNIVWDNEY